MQVKKGASIQGLSLKMRYALIAADNIWQNLGQELVITSGTDGVHSASSLHYYGYALDFRTRYFNDTEKHTAYLRLCQALEDKGFQVIKEKSHIHVEYDRIKTIYGID